MNTNIRVKTAQAADVAGVGYEGFRTWLKRGLLKGTGVLPQFYAPDTPAQLTDAKRWRWSAFGFADLCSFRLTKILLDTGMPWEVVNPIVSDHHLWQSHHDHDDAARYLAIFQNTSQWTLYSAETLATDLDNGTIKSEWMTLIDLRQLRQNVVFRNRAAALRTLGDEMTRTSGSFIKSDSNVPTANEIADRKTTIETLADEIRQLAIEAEQGSGSYEKFELLRAKLHLLGKFPDNSAVSAVAAAFVE